MPLASGERAVEGPAGEVPAYNTSILIPPSELRIHT